MRVCDDADASADPTFRSVLDQLLSDTVYMLASRGIILDQQLVRGELRIDGFF